MYPSPPLGWHGIMSVNEEKPRKLPQLECHPLSSMRVKIELLTSGIRAVLSYRLDISCSSPSQAAVAAAAVLVAASAAALAAALIPSSSPERLRLRLLHAAAP